MCYAHYHPRERISLGPEVESVSSLGIHMEKGWRLYDLERQEFQASHDVVFHEDVFPFVEFKQVESMIEKDGILSGIRVDIDGVTMSEFRHT